MNVNSTLVFGGRYRVTKQPGEEDAIIVDTLTEKRVEVNRAKVPDNQEAMELLFTQS